MSDEILPGYTRVSSILKPFSGIDKIPPLALENARERGLRVESHCFAFIRGTDPFFTVDEDKPYFESFLKWYEGSTIDIEPRFYDQELMITGKPDLIRKDGDQYIIYDLKATYKEGITWPLQGAAYAYLAEKSGFPIRRIEFVRLKKDGSKPKTYVYEKKKYFDLFMHCYETYKYFYNEVKSEHESEDVPCICACGRIV